MFLLSAARLFFINHVPKIDFHCTDLILPGKQHTHARVDTNEYKPLKYFNIINEIDDENSLILS